MIVRVNDVSKVSVVVFVIGGRGRHLGRGVESVDGHELPLNFEGGLVVAHLIVVADEFLELFLLLHVLGLDKCWGLQYFGTHAGAGTRAAVFAS